MVVAGGSPDGCGDVLRAVPSEDAGGKAAQGRDGTGQLTGAGFGFVLAVGAVADVVQEILDAQ
ncbi:hypothetical protein ACIO8F_16515 [Streptomyces sp. NPDC087228]|uniref:hypothetical protein n=1 Tax=Streptomyces sp. NPDC087228 TaxID=3365772 RepID=UPI003817D4A3